MIKKILPAIFIVLLIFVGIIALTQESDLFFPGQSDEFTENENENEEEELEEDFFLLYQFERELPEWILPARWFRSNSGGMALEEIPSRFAALRNEYALVIDYTTTDELPEFLHDFYDNDFFIEIRKLFKNGEETRTQWIFRDINTTTRLIAVLARLDDDDEEETITEEIYIYETAYYDYDDIFEYDYAEDDNEYDDIDTVAMEEIESDDIENIVNRIRMTGFIEIFDENSLITMEYRYFDDGSISRIEYNYRDGIIISAAASVWEDDNEHEEFVLTHIDFFRYNRSSFLRSIERVFYTDRQISALEDPVLLSFPANILEAARGELFINERLHSYPEFFENIFVMADSRIVYDTDERGRVLSQTLYDMEDNVIWVVVNTWLGERIVSILKTEDDIELLAEYEYDQNDNLFLERNFRNGVLERLVRAEGNRDIEELFMDNVVVLQAVWEDGRKISETRVRNN